MPEKNIISQDERHIFIPNKISSQNKCLGQSLRGRLYRIRKIDSKLRAIAK